MTSEHRYVRPTFDCLGVLGVKLPTLDVSLDSVDHPLVAKAQKVPDLMDSNDAEPILSLHDRRWLKVKTGEFRGGVTVLGAPAEWAEVCEEDSFWLGLAGKRRSDTPSKDFYATLPAKTDDFLPKEKDWKRWKAEQAVAAHSIMQKMVRKCAWLSLNTSRAFCFPVADGLVWVQIQMMESGIVYVAIGAHGLTDPVTYVILMSSLPGVSADDWLPEPDGIAGISVDSGEMVFSAILEPSDQGLLMDEAEENEWALELG